MNRAGMKKGSCPACGGVSLADVGVKHSQAYYRCRACRVVVGSSLWEQDAGRDAEERYDERYLDGTRSFHPATTSRLANILERLEGYTQGRRLFEVGFGNGQLLYTARERGWDVRGVEVSVAACARASREFSLPVVEGRFEELEIDEESVDVVASMETIEHMYDPMAFVRRAREVLRPGGLIFLTTPNARCITARLTGLAWRGYGDGHTVLFPARSLGRLLRKEGFEVLRMETRTVVPGAILSRWRDRLRGRTALPVSGAQCLRDLHETRDRIDGSPVLRAAKTVTNAVLNVTGTGEKTLVWARKPRSDR